MDFNTIYNMDTARICDDVNDMKDLCVCQRFTPCEDQSYLINKDKVEAVYCNPYDQSKTVKIDYSIRQLNDLLQENNMYVVSKSKLTGSIVCNIMRNGPDVMFFDLGEYLTVICSNSNLWKNSTNERDLLPTSLIYITKDGVKKFCYGTLVIVSKGCKSLPKQVQWYFLSNTYRMFMDKFGYTITMIVYEDTLERLFKESEIEEVDEDVQDV